MHQVDISQKHVVRRVAEAEGYIKLKHSTIERIKKGVIEKGDPLSMAQIGGILAAKNVPNMLPLCHQLKLENVEVEATISENNSSVRVHARVVANEKTGVEMEALMAATIGLLNVWDLVKQYEKDERGQYPDTEIYGVRVLKKVKEGQGDDR